MTDPHRMGNRTRLGHAVREPEPEPEPEPEADAAAPQSSPPPIGQAPIEILYVQENELQPVESAWRAFEIWTTNNVYMVSGEMRCIAVINRATGRPEPHHSFLGARLSGGERRQGKVVDLTAPLPVPGTSAVFRHPPSGRLSRFGTTSPVERVVLRIRVATVTVGDAETAWEELSTFRRQ